jgi:hypothetical protein
MCVRGERHCRKKSEKRKKCLRKQRQRFKKKKIRLRKERQK